MTIGSAEPPKAGHNSIVGATIKSFVERVERLEEEKKAIADDIREVYSEAKGEGLDTKILRRLVADRKKDESLRREEEEMLDLYKAAIGMV